MGTLALGTGGECRADNYSLGNGQTLGRILARVKFNGIGTPTITASRNVSSLTDQGVGLYDINFASPTPVGNYSTVGNCETGFVTLSAVTTTVSVRIFTRNNSGTPTDYDGITAVIVD